MGGTFFSHFMEGFASIGRAMTRMSVAPRLRNLDEVQQDLAEKYGITFDDTYSARSDWEAVGADMKHVLDGLQNKKVGL